MSHERPSRRRHRRRRRLLVATVAALVAVGVAQLADLATFLRMIDVHGIEAELNPLVSAVATHHGTDVLIVAKLGLIVFVVAAFAIIATQRERLAASVLTFATIAGLVGATSNVIALA
jgi:hypothetical protein